MVKVYLDSDERYPVYSLTKGNAPKWSLSPSIDISEEDLREHYRIEEEWLKHQLWLAELCKK